MAELEGREEIRKEGREYCRVRGKENVWKKKKWKEMGVV